MCASKSDAKASKEFFIATSTTIKEQPAIAGCSFMAEKKRFRTRLRKRSSEILKIIKRLSCTWISSVHHRPTSPTKRAPRLRCSFCWRRRRDSNSRTLLQVTRFPIVRPRPTRRLLHKLFAFWTYSAIIS